jgi:hypothetical protein
MDGRLCDTSTISRKKPKTGHIGRHFIKAPQTMVWSDSQYCAWINSAGLGLDPLYERFLGRPFAGHRDSVSELVGDVLETAIEGVLNRAGISNRKTKRAERVTGFDQAPDFIIPNEFNPQIVIEAKITEDDGTARDKVTRVQHLGELSTQGLQPDEPPRFEVVACIAGRGFKVRREDMKKLILATRGKVFTLQTLSHLVDCTKLAEFRTRTATP